MNLWKAYSMWHCEASHFIINLSKRWRSLWRSISITVLNKIHHPGRRFCRRKIYVRSSDQRKLWQVACHWDALLSEIILPPTNQDFTVPLTEGSRMLDGNLCALSANIWFSFRSKTTIFHLVMICGTAEPNLLSGSPYEESWVVVLFSQTDTSATCIQEST